ncbi:MAG TPA: glycosyltransferase, partial [Solirubrobacteraceae bacterium]|nr:glycosyltransferase [Solirubrobacteraceae bacterium]
MSGASPAPARRGPAPGAVPPSARVAAVGVSVRSPCGVHDHATLLAAALSEAGVPCSLHWLQRDAPSLSAARSQQRVWLRGLHAGLARERPDAVLLHYSVFALSHRGLPVFVPPTVAALRRARIPLIVFGHELAFPWRRGRGRGAAWALTQRAALVGLLRASSGVLVTADFRVRWLRSRRWLPRRPLALAPVFSNLPPPGGGSAGGDVVGVFGYNYDPAATALALDALALLRERVPAARLLLLGAPGPRSSSGRAWLDAARRRGLATAVSFTGALPAQELSDALAARPVLLFADTPGPTSRKGTLAGALASGTPLVAADGPQCWSELAQAGAARIVSRYPAALAAALGELLADG